jgi:hypothetical protein
LKNQGNDKKKSSWAEGAARQVISYLTQRSRIGRSAHAHAPPQGSNAFACGIAEALSRRLAHDENKKCSPRPQNRQIALFRFAAPEAGGQYAAVRSTFL